MRADPHFVSSIIWAMLVLLSWIGWGAAIRKMFRLPRFDVGLQCSWGIAFVVLLGGPLNVLRACSPTVVNTITLVGAGLGALDTAKRFPHGFANIRVVSGVLPRLMIVAVGILCLLSSMSVLDRSLNVFDDLPFYMTLPQRMLETGSAIDPLNARRLSTFGGFAFLQTQMWPHVDEQAVRVTDAGMAGLCVVMLLAGATRQIVSSRWGLVAVTTLFWLYPVSQQNVTAMFATTAMALATLRTVDEAGRRSKKYRLRLLSVAAMTAAVLATFRGNLQVVAPLFFLGYGLSRLRKRPEDWRLVVRELAIVALTGVLCLLPWSIALQQACGSYVFPLMSGNQRDPGFDFVPAGMAWSTRLISVWDCLTAKPFILTYLPAVFLLERRHRVGLLMFGAAVLTSGLTAFALPLAEIDWLERFCVPLLMAPAFYGLLVGLHCFRRRPLLRGGLWLAIVGIALTIWPLSYTAMHAQRIIRQAANAMTRQAPLFNPAVRSEYANLQSAVPPGASLAVALDCPTLLDFGRNSILCLDVPGAATRRGLWPVGQGPAKLKAFLAEQEVEYVAFFDFGNAAGLYRAAYWERALDRPEITAPRMLDMMTALDQLAQIEKPVYEHAGYRVLKIR